MGGPSLLTPGYLPDHQTWHVMLHPDGYLMLEDEEGHDPLRHPVKERRIGNWFTASQADPFKAITKVAMKLLDDLLRGDPDFEHLHEYYVSVLRQTEPTGWEIQRLVTATRFLPLRQPAELVELDLSGEELRRKEG